MRAGKKHHKPGAAPAPEQHVVSDAKAAAQAKTGGVQTGVTIVWHQLEEKAKDGQFWAWSFVSKNLEKSHVLQDNLIISIRAKPGETQDQYPASVYQLFKLVQMEAQAGRPVTEGATTELNGTGSIMPDAPHLRALIWIRAQIPLPGVMLPEGRYLMGVFVHAHELAVAKAHGVTRLVSMLGSAASYYPCPFWTDRLRTPIITDEQILKRSMLTAFSRVRMPLARAMLQQKQHVLLLRLPTYLRNTLNETIDKYAKEGTYAMLVGHEPEAEGHLVWTPATPEKPAPAKAITKANVEGSTLGGSFIAFLSEQKETHITVYEDGFMVLLSKDQFNAVCTALKETKDYVVKASAPGQVELRIEFLLSEWRNPIDGTIITSPAGFAKYSSGESASSPGPVEDVALENVALLSTDAHLKEYMPSTEALSNYIIALHLEVRLQESDAPSLRIAAQPASALSEDMLAKLKAVLLAVPHPQLKKDAISKALKISAEVAFVLNFKITRTSPSSSTNDSTKNDASPPAATSEGTAALP